jgi:hypothetical protein
LKVISCVAEGQELPDALCLVFFISVGSRIKYVMQPPLRIIKALVLGEELGNQNGNVIKDFPIV